MRSLSLTVTELFIVRVLTVKKPRQISNASCLGTCQLFLCQKSFSTIKLGYFRERINTHKRAANNYMLLFVRFLYETLLRANINQLRGGFSNMPNTLFPSKHRRF